MIRSFLLIILLVISFVGNSQTLGGNTVFSFLKIPASPQLSALGGINVSAITKDIALAYHNPSLLNNEMDGQVQFAFQQLFRGIKNLHLVTGFHHEKWQTNFGLGINYLDHGKFNGTDASGNLTGDFRATDYVVQLSASRNYNPHIDYGIAVKFIHSKYAEFNSAGLAMDVGISYHDSSGVQASIVLKNMGLQFKPYSGSEASGLPFDIQAGITKRLKKAPLQFSLTAHHLHRFDIFYNDSTLNIDNSFVSKSSFANKLFRHLVFAVQVFPSKHLEITVGYNFLRRTELEVGGISNGLNGFSFGAGFSFRKIEARYSRSYYQHNKASSHLGINIPLKDYL